MGAYYTILTGVGLTNLATTITHNLSITPASLVVRPIHPPGGGDEHGAGRREHGRHEHRDGVSGVGTTVTCDIEVQMIHSIIS